MSWPCLRPRDGAARLDLSVMPNAKRTQADGLHDGALRVRLAAPPVDGKANEVLVAWLADQLGLPRRAITLVRGQSSRRKTLEVAATEAVVRTWLDGLLGRRADEDPR